MAKTQPRIRALLEVVAVFVLAALLFQGMRLTPLREWEEEILPGQGLFFLEYGAVLAAVLALLAIFRRDWVRYGITLRDGRQQARVIAVGFLPVLALGGVLGMVNWRTWAGSAAVSAAAIGVLFLIGWWLRDKGNSKGVVMGLALLALAPAASQSGAAQSAVLKTIYFYLLVGPAEELLFRGYIQTRLNEAYGKPFRFFGTEWGWGLVMASALFGLWHVVWRPLDGGAWMQALWTCFAGLIFGYVREKSQGLAAGSVLHSVMNYFPLFDLVAR